MQHQSSNESLDVGAGSDDDMDVDSEGPSPDETHDNVDTTETVADYEALIKETERKEDEDLYSAINDEVEEVRESGGCGEVLVATEYSAERLKEMSSPFVTDDSGNKVHKKAVLKLINEGKSLSKSFDRAKRVRDEARSGRATGSSANNVIARAFHFSHDYSLDPNSGSDLHCTDDYCCILVKSLRKAADDTPKQSFTHMALGKFQRFGSVMGGTPLELSWPKSKDEFRASVAIICAVDYTDGHGQKCLRSTGEVMAFLKNVHSSCLYSILPSMESVEQESGMLSTHAVMKLSDLIEIFNILSNRRLHQRPHHEVNIVPITIDAKTPFVTQVKQHNNDGDLPICNICNPPKKIGQSDMTDGHMIKAVYNHAAAHQLATPFAGEPCGLCCQLHCKVEIHISSQKRKSILNGKGKLDPGSLVVQHNCKTFLSLGDFPLKYCPPIARFPCSNKPIMCLACKEGVPRFVWSWNIEAHYQNVHSGISSEERDKYKEYIVTDEEKKDINKYFPLNVLDE